MTASSFSNLSDPSGSALSEPGFGIGLGISGLPELNSDMLGGGLYAMSVRTSSARFPLLSGCLQNALNAGLSCMIVTASEPADLLARLDMPNGFSSAGYLADGQLSVFSMQEEFSKKMFLFGADRLVQELESFEAPVGGFLLFEQADELLSLHDVGLALQQVKILAKWCKQRQLTGLLAFSQSNDQKLETLNNLLDHLTGIVRLGGDRDGLELTFLYWRSSQGVVAAQNFPLYTNASGLYSVSRRRIERGESFGVAHFKGEEDEDWSEQLLAPTTNAHVVANVRAPMHAPHEQTPHAHAPQAQRPSRDPASSEDGRAPAFLRTSVSASVPQAAPDSNSSHVFLYSDPELEVLQNLVPGDWQFVARMEHILHAALHKPRAMILISTDQSVAEIELARTVHVMRKTLGLGVQILVRETEREVDENYKQLLLHSGANVVVSKDVALGYYPKFLGSLRNQTYSRSFEPDFDSISIGHSEVNSLSLEQLGSNLGPSPSKSFSFPGNSAMNSEPMAQRAIAKAKRSSLVV